MGDASSRSPDVETALHWMRDTADEPDNKPAPNDEKFGMGFLGKRITDTLPRGQSTEHRVFRAATRALPPNHRPLLAAMQATLMERVRWWAGLGRAPA